MSNKVCDYDYILPPNLIASHPIFPKQNARLLVFYRQTSEIRHLKFADLSDVLPHCAIVFNDTKVVKARIFGTKQSGGKIELLLNSPLNENKFSVFIKGSVKIGNILNFDNNLQAEVLELNDDFRVVKFSQNGQILDAQKLFALLEIIGHTPLPPYIKRPDTKDDENFYQSIFAMHDGAVAAPTASLHFDDEMLTNLNKNHEIYYLTLHVGAGTFKPVVCDNLNEHKIHSEYYNIPQPTQNLIKSNKNILGVGTTVTRAIEYFAKTGLGNGFCDLFLNPQNPPIRQNFLLTNFHLPKS
nr:tRNA preQ1(34) S-adenosylmethionine ribosyltransferase-isomerase QueA [Campylobacter sp.]